MRTKLIAGNWKMNAGPAEAKDLLKQLNHSFKNKELQSEVLVCPPFVSLHLAISYLQDTPVKTGAQNVHFEDDGAFTGEISVRMLKEAGCEYVVVGHSERREYFGENDETVARKVIKALDGGLKVILCVGEKLEERKAGEQEKVVARQLAAVAGKPGRDQLSSLVVAYEPVWAIGTGETATPDQAQEMHAFIRRELAGIWEEDAVRRLRILYGGSMKPENAGDLLNRPDVDGGLIGGASLKAKSFVEIVETAEKTYK